MYELTPGIVEGDRDSASGKFIKPIVMNDTTEEMVIAEEKDYKKFENFVHRTFNSTGTIFFLKSLNNIYKNHGGLENAFSYSSINDLGETGSAIVNFRNTFFSINHPERTKKHVSNPAENSSAKRLCMYLRWMIRKDKQGVDFPVTSHHHTGVW